MRTALRSSTFLAVAVLTVTIATSRPGRAADALWSVPGQAAAGVYLQEWSQFLWGLLARQTGTLPIWGDQVDHPDGSSSRSFSAPDGTEGLITYFPDSSIRVEITLPDGTSQTIEQEPEVPGPDPAVSTLVFHVTSSDGFALDYTRVHDDRGTYWDHTDDWMQLTGTGALPSGLSQSFTVTATGGTAELESKQSDGSTYSMSVPLDQDAAELPEMLPDLTEAAYGTYADPTIAVQFTLTSTPKFPLRWAALLTDVAGGVAGTLSLDEDFSALGQLEVDGILAALVCWTRHGDVQVCDLTGQNVQMGPAGGALDFLRYQWQTLTALDAPAWGASSPAARPRRALRRRPRQPLAR